LRGLFARPEFGLGAAIASVLAVAAIAVGSGVFSGDDEGSSELVIVNRTSASGEIDVREDERLIVMDLEGLEVPPEGLVYQVWAIDDGSPASLGLIEVSPSGEVDQEMVYDEADSFAVTVEQAPGVDQPTTDPVITVER
jgi:anti-sigma-K factor RskA